MAAEYRKSSVASSDTLPHGSPKDAALVFLRDYGRTESLLQATDVDLRRLRRKVDLLVLPFLVLCYTLNTLDKVLLNYSNVMGIAPDLHLTENDFSTAASAFWIAATVSAVFCTVPLQKVPTGKWIAFCLTFWGITTACHSVVKNYEQLVAVRVASGLLEASLVPAVMLLTSQYFARREQAVRYSIWYSGLGLGQISGGLLSFAFQHVPPTSPLASWRIMFLAIGCFTLFVGVAVWILVPDTPMQARFLSTTEKAMLLDHVKANQTGIADRTWQPRQILEALIDPQFWLMSGAILLQGTGGGFISAYSATLLHNFGFTTRIAALLILPMGLINILSITYTGLGGRLTHNRRHIFTLSAMGVGLSGVAMMACAPPTHKATLLAGLYLANFFTGCTPLCFQWFTANTAGHTKRAFVAGSTNAAFALGNVVGPLTFRARDAPEYHAAKLDLLCMWAGSMACLVLVTGWYVFENRRRDARGKSEVVDREQGFAGLTDRENASFRYAL